MGTRSGFEGLQRTVAQDMLHKHTNAGPPSKIEWSKLGGFYQNPAFDDKEGLK
jgi:hypothetical protein